MDRKEHMERHQELHIMLDELVGDWITQTNCLPSKNTVLDLMKWSNMQQIDPTEKEN